MYFHLSTPHFRIIAVFAAAAAATLFLLLPSIGAAQLPSGALTPQARIEFTPQHPAPGERVRATVRAGTLDLSRAMIRWEINGSVQNEARGAEQVIFTAPEGGKQAQVDVVVQTQRRGTLSSTRTLRPGSVAFLWDAGTYTPPFYKGRSRITAQSTLTLVAIPALARPGGGAYTADELDYQWERNGRVLGSRSGVGKRTLSITAPFYREDVTYTVTVSSLDGNTSAQRRTALSSTVPRVRFYTENPLTGIAYHNALEGTQQLTQEEMTVRAEPYFFSTEQREDSIAYTWYVDNKRAQPKQGSPSSIILRNVSERSGRARIELQATHRSDEQFGQRAGNSFFLEFSGTEED